jgi:hypothetical protein
LSQIKVRVVNCAVGCRHCSINFASPNAPLPYRGGVLPLARSPNDLVLAAGNLTGTCGEVLTTRGAPSGEAWLFSVSISRMNFSASMGVASLVSSGLRAITAPAVGAGGRMHCLPQVGTMADDGQATKIPGRVVTTRASHPGLVTARQ